MKAKQWTKGGAAMAMTFAAGMVVAAPPPPGEMVFMTEAELSVQAPEESGNSVARNPLSENRTSMPEVLKAMMPLASPEVIHQVVSGSVVFNGAVVEGDLLLGDFYGRTGFFDVNPEDFVVAEGDSLASVMQQSGVSVPAHFDTLAELQRHSNVRHVILSLKEGIALKGELKRQYWFAVTPEDQTVVAALAWTPALYESQSLESHHFRLGLGKPEVVAWLDSDQPRLTESEAPMLKQDLSAFADYLNAPHQTRANIFSPPYIWGKYEFKTERDAVAYARMAKGIPTVDMNKLSMTVYRSFGDLVADNGRPVPLRENQASMLASHPDHYLVILSETQRTPLDYAHTVWAFDRHSHAPFMTLLFNNPGDR